MTAPPDLTTCVISVRYQGLLWYMKNQSAGSHLETALTLGIGCHFAKVSQPMGGSQESVARSAARGGPGAAICLPPLCVCVCERENERYGMIIICIMPSAHTHTRKGASFHSRLNYTGLIGFFFSWASKTKTLLSYSPPSPPLGPSNPSSSLAFLFLSSVFPL